MKYRINKNIFKKILCIVFSLMIVLSFGDSVFAASNKDFVVKKDDTYNKTNMLNVYSSFSNDGIIDGGVIVYSPKITNNGAIKGDVISIAGSFINKGNVEGNVLGYYNKLYLNNSKVGKNVYVISNEIISKDKMSINGDLSIYAKKVELKGEIKGDVKVVAEEVTLDAIIDGEVKVSSEDIVLGNNLVVKSNLYYESKQPIVKSKGSVVEGAVQQKELGYRLIPTESIANAINLLGNSYSVFCYFSILIIGMILSRMFPISMYKSEVILKRNVLTSLSLGSLCYIMILPIMFLLSITGVGIPVAVALLGAFTAIYYISLLPASIFLGGMFIRGEGRFTFKLLIGIMILYALKRMPFYLLNSIITIFVSMVGFGSIIFMIVAKIRFRYKNERKDMDNLMKAIMKSRNKSNQYRQNDLNEAFKKDGTRKDYSKIDSFEKTNEDDKGEDDEE